MSGGSDLLGSDRLFEIGGAATGVVLGPLVVVLVGRHLGRAARAGASGGAPRR
ncbi:hypothetical protein [Nocardioides sediminis]|uniref:hypothetical protein n=1 Tax=Nocardioides sediminis TaxID=433648 RepID=UPI00131F410A|nr:hypothetical protein [Nocardioides sediminis]